MNAHTHPPAAAAAPAVTLTDLDRALIDGWQRGFPLSPAPYAAIAAALGTDVETVLQRLAWLQSAGVLSRVGPVIRPRRVGASTLGALAVPRPRLQEVAALVSAHPGVNHNYEREHHYNLWFVVTAADGDAVTRVLADIEARTGLPPLDLPLLTDYHIDLGFPIDWS